MRRVVQRSASMALAGVFGLFTVTAAAPAASGTTAAVRWTANAGAAQVDTDLDGVPDYGDACPTIPGMGDNHGCPGAEPPDVIAAGTQRLDSGRIAVRATCNQPCVVRASGKVERRRLGSTEPAHFAPPSAPVKLTLRLSSAKRSELRAVLRRRASVTATITVTATMEGDPQSTTVTVKLTR